MFCDNFGIDLGKKKNVLIWNDKYKTHFIGFKVTSVATATNKWTKLKGIKVTALVTR